MFSGVEARVLDGIAAAPVLQEPFPHCVIDGCSRSTSTRPSSITGRKRKAGSRCPSRGEGRRAFWAQQVASWLLGEEFRARVMAKFALKQADGASDALIVSDRSTYAIGPHTDAPHRRVSLLFYLPEDSTFRRFGTALYAPLDPQFRCPGGPHHRFEFFRRVKTVESFTGSSRSSFPASTGAC